MQTERSNHRQLRSGTTTTAPLTTNKPTSPNTTTANNNKLRQRHRQILKTTFLLVLWALIGLNNTRDQECCAPSATSRRHPNPRSKTKPPEPLPSFPPDPKPPHPRRTGPLLPHQIEGSRQHQQWSRPTNNARARALPRRSSHQHRQQILRRHNTEEPPTSATSSSTERSQHTSRQYTSPNTHRTTSRYYSHMHPNLAAYHTWMLGAIVSLHTNATQRQSKQLPPPRKPSIRHYHTQKHTQKRAEKHTFRDHHHTFQNACHLLQHSSRSADNSAPPTSTQMRPSHKDYTNRDTKPSHLTVLRSHPKAPSPRTPHSSRQQHANRRGPYPPTLTPTSTQENPIPKNHLLTPGNTPPTLTTPAPHTPTTHQKETPPQGSQCKDNNTHTTLITQNQHTRHQTIHKAYQHMLPSTRPTTECTPS